MASNSYHLISHWRVEGTVEEVSAILKDTAELVRWWPAVYLEVRELAPGNERGIGKVVSLHTKGWLPYTLRWQFRVTESREPFGFTLEATGDLVGCGIWTFTQDKRWVNITYDWEVRAAKPLLRFLSFLLKPLFTTNHVWAMEKGEESLRLELARRHAATPEERTGIPAPSGPIPTVVLLLWLGAVIGVGSGLAYLLTQIG